MSYIYNFEATTDFFQSIRSIDILTDFAKIESAKGNEDNRRLFLKLSVVLIVTKFQVYVESILTDFLYVLKDKRKKKNNELSIHIRLKSIKLYADKNSISKELENPKDYNTSKLSTVKELISKLQNFCIDNTIISNDFEINTKFPLGKTGSNELKDLFFQVGGEDIFQNNSIDQRKLDEILGRRHAIIHEDNNPQITELTIREYQSYIEKLVVYIDYYLRLVLI